MNSSPTRKPQYYLLLILVLTIIVLSVGNYLRWWDLHFSVGPFSFHHWAGIVGAGYLAVITPVYSIMKRRSPQRFGMWLNIHVYGNLSAFLLISIHFTQQMGRPAQFAPVLGTGLALYIITAIMALTGLMQKLRLIGRFLKSWRFIHVSLSLSFHIVALVHILRNLGII